MIQTESTLQEAPKKFLPLVPREVAAVQVEGQHVRDLSAFSASRPI